MARRKSIERTSSNKKYEAAATRRKLTLWTNCNQNTLRHLRKKVVWALVRANRKAER
jgi:hypothetical protein